MALIARHFARQRNLPFVATLQRRTNTKQRAASARQRTTNAKEAFAVHKKPDPEKIYLLIDDVVTTGATIKYATKTLLDAGAMTVWVASISRQPLD